MRALVVIIVIGIGAVGCTAVTDFDKFHIASDGGGDLAAGKADLSYSPASFGQPCNPTQTTPCVPGQSAPGRPLVCYQILDGHPVTGNICTRECVPGPAACTDYGSASCAMVGSTVSATNYCVPACDLPSVPCRVGLTCCNQGSAVSSGAGACVPFCP